MTIGDHVIWNHNHYVVVRIGCATDWDQCPHGADAVALRRAVKPATWPTECAPSSRLAFVEE